MVRLHSLVMGAEFSVRCITWDEARTDLVAPAEKAGDAAVIAFVKANPGAIGYISGGVTADGVKLLSIR